MWNRYGKIGETAEIFSGFIYAVYIYILYIYRYSLIKSFFLQCLRSCHRIQRSCPRLQEVVHVSQKLCLN